jgi:uncharacterized protein (DUF1330 family)
MKYYAVFEVEITDPGWVQAYVQNVTGMVERQGGRYLARTSTIERIEGERKPAQVMVILEWPSKEAALAFYNSDEYRPYRQSRLRGGRNESVLVPGEDVAGLARMAE